MINFFVIFFAFVTNLSNCFSTEITLKDIRKFGDGFNIEGGYLATMNTELGQEWGDLCMVLDIPFYDHKT